MDTLKTRQTLYWSAYFAGFHDQVVDSTALWYDTLTKEEADVLIIFGKTLGAEHRKEVLGQVPT
jgi:hypothetical protein